MSPGLLLPVPLSQYTTQELGHRVSVYYQSTSHLKRQQVNTSKNCLTHSPDWLGVFQGKSGRSSGGYRRVPGVCMEPSLRQCGSQVASATQEQ